MRSGMSEGRVWRQFDLAQPGTLDEYEIVECPDFSRKVDWPCKIVHVIEIGALEAAQAEIARLQTKIKELESDEKEGV